MVGSECFVAANEQTKKAKTHRCYNLLKHIKLNQAEKPAVALEPNAVGRHLKNVFQQGNPPTNDNYRDDPQLAEPFSFVKL
jgi:hypothetical protein